MLTRGQRVTRCSDNRHSFSHLLCNGPGYSPLAVRRCTNLTNCFPGEAVLVAPTETSDRVCSPCGNGYTQALNVDACEVYTECDDSQYVVVEPTATSDRQCATIPDGSYVPDQGSSPQPCTPGSYCLNGKREECDLGTSYQDSPGSSRCKVTTVCLGDERVKASPTTTSDRTCELVCAPGSEPKGVQCSVCRPGTRERNGVCELCEPGTVQISQGMTRCLACEVGSVQPDAGQTLCFVCSAGSYDTGMNTCQPCPVGRYQSEAGQSRCEPCEIGTFAGSPGATKCEPCGPGTFSAVRGMVACKNHTACNATSIATVAPTATSDRVCEPAGM